MNLLYSYRETATTFILAGYVPIEKASAALCWKGRSGSQFFYFCGLLNVKCDPQRLNSSRLNREILSSNRAEMLREILWTDQRSYYKDRIFHEKNCKKPKPWSSFMYLDKGMNFSFTKCLSLLFSLVLDFNAFHRESFVFLYRVLLIAFDNAIRRGNSTALPSVWKNMLWENNSFAGVVTNRFGLQNILP